MTPKIESSKTVDAPAAAPAAPSTIRTFDGAKNFITESLAKQNDVHIVSMEVEKVSAGDIKGQRIRLELSGDGIDNPTRRYFLRNNSQFASGIEDVGLHLHTPKKERNTTTYIMYLGMTENVVSYEPPAAAKAEKVLLTPEQRKDRRLAGKQAKRLERASAAAERAEAGESAPAVEAAKTVAVGSTETVEA